MTLLPYGLNAGPLLPLVSGHSGSVHPGHYMVISIYLWLAHVFTNRHVTMCGPKSIIHDTTCHGDGGHQLRGEG